MLANVTWLHVNNCCKGAVACLYQEGGITGMMFCHQTSGPKTGWAYKYIQKLHNSDRPSHSQLPNSRGHTHGYKLESKTVINTQTCNSRNMCRTMRPGSFITFKQGHSA